MLCINLLEFGGLFLVAVFDCAWEFSTVTSLHLALAEPQL